MADAGLRQQTGSRLIVSTKIVLTIDVIAALDVSRPRATAGSDRGSTVVVRWGRADREFRQRAGDVLRCEQIA